MSPQMVEAIGNVIVRVGFPTALVIIYVLKDWAFTTKIVANNARITTILEVWAKEGIRCRHD